MPCIGAGMAAGNMATQDHPPGVMLRALLMRGPGRSASMSLLCAMGGVEQARQPFWVAASLGGWAAGNQSVGPMQLCPQGAHRGYFHEAYSCMSGASGAWRACQPTP